MWIFNFLILHFNILDFKKIIKYKKRIAFYIFLIMKYFYIR